MSDKRSPIYYYKFDLSDDKKTITKVKGIQFVEQELNIPCDDTQFLTLRAADKDGHLMGLLKCWVGYDLIKEIASLPQLPDCTPQRLVAKGERNYLK